MINEIHWFDLDSTLWNTNSKWWILDKKNPENPILKISQYEGQLIKIGSYMNDNNKIYYNGFTGWLSNELLTKIKQRKDIDIENIGITFREYIDKNLIIKQSENLFIYINRLKDIKTRTINILTSRANKDAHKELLDILSDKLKDIDIKINKSIFVKDSKNTNLTGTTQQRKLQILIESLIGYKIKEDRFIPFITESYDICYFYDDEDINIEECSYINENIKLLLNNTTSWLKERIKLNIDVKNKKLILNLVTSNEMNPFEVTEIDIKLL